jgi:hypothetical protein
MAVKGVVHRVQLALVRRGVVGHLGLVDPVSLASASRWFVRDRSKGDVN